MLAATSLARPQRLLFMGSPLFAVEALQALVQEAARYEIVGVFTQPDKVAGRGKQLQACPVKRYSLAAGLRVFTPTSLKDPTLPETLAALAPELIVVVAYGKILPPWLLALPRYGCLNVHASLLPKYRGASPITQALLHGEKFTGISLMQMDQGLDTGPVYGQQVLMITPQDTAETLSLRLARLGAEMLRSFLPLILSAKLISIPQTQQGVSYAPLLRKEDGHLEVNLAAETLARRVRGLNPWPMAFVYVEGERLQLLEAQAAATVNLPAQVAPEKLNPGALWLTSDKQVLLTCRDSYLVLTTVKPAGRKSMSAYAWALGRGSPTFLGFAT